MVKRLYADGFRCLANFELKLDRLVLLLGENGSGKTTVFEVLHRLQAFMLGRSDIEAVFSFQTLTRWHMRFERRFELDVQVGTDVYLYVLTLELGSDLESRVQTESLKVNDKVLFTVSEGMVRLSANHGELGEGFPFDPKKSVIGSFLPNNYSYEISRFRSEIEKIIICSFEPMNMKLRSEKEVKIPARNMNDFVSWYRYLSQEYQGAIFKMNEELREVLPGFRSFSLKEGGENVRTMFVEFQTDDQASSRARYAFDELSDGQRVLVILYTLLYGLEDRGAYLFLDEPENFVALREIQPWLTALYDRVGGAVKQAVLISHHPEIIDYLNATDSRWFQRAANGPVRVSMQVPGDQGGSLPPSETMARGWEK